jgi:hypothetical protein
MRIVMAEERSSDDKQTLGSRTPSMATQNDTLQALEHADVTTLKSLTRCRLHLRRTRAQHCMDEGGQNCSESE